MTRWLAVFALLLFTSVGVAVGMAVGMADDTPTPVPSEQYSKHETRIPMRDGSALFTVIYTPKDDSRTYPILMVRTPYGSGAEIGEALRYGVHHVDDSHPLGPSWAFDQAGYIYVFQDVRGRYMSEGQWIEMTPHRSDKRGDKDVDESSDTHDSIDWLLGHVPNHNGRVGLWGISYPGFYTAASIIDSHPAIRAASPQAPIADLYLGDDAYHGGAFMLAANFNFYSAFTPQHNPTPQPSLWTPYDYGTPDGYDFFLNLQSLSAIEGKLTQEQRALWADQVQHDRYDDYWKTRSLPQYLRNIRCAVLNVGGWYDAEDPQGPLSVYHAIESKNPSIFNALVMGPWAHGSWAGDRGRRLGHVDFQSDTSAWYQDQLLLPFFEQHLRAGADARLAEATVFETGSNTWRRFDQWPPKNAQPRKLYLQPGGGLGWQPPKDGAASSRWIANPARPVPFTSYPAVGVPREYMTGDQRFAARRPDVLVFQSDPLEADLTIAGPIEVDLQVATSGTDADWVVKLIDVYPPDYPEPPEELPEEPPVLEADDVPPPVTPLAGYQQLVRGEPLRGKFRNSFEQPEPFVPGQVTRLTYSMPDVLHSFRRGHRIMVQVHSSWFPLIDLNPQTFMRIADALPEDFRTAEQQLFHSPSQASALRLRVIPNTLAALP